MAKFSQFRHVRGLIQQDRDLAVLLPQAERLRELNRRFARAVSAALARACQVVALTDGEASIHCGNGAAAGRLRSLSGTVVRALSTSSLPVERLKVRVRADWSLPERPEKAGMGPGALAAWDELEHQLPDSDLKTAVEHLLRHQQRGR